jgi:hypothetical protein
VIEIVPLYDGSLEFYCEITRDNMVSVREPRSHSFTNSYPSGGASDAIVQGSKKVQTLQNANFARELGFATKLFRMPDLDIGAIRAVELNLKKTFESFRKHDLVIRPDLGLTVGDVYVVSYTASGTGTVVSHSIIVEKIGLEGKMSGGRVGSSMSISGREVYVEPA